MNSKGVLVAKRTTGVVFFPAYDWAISPTHPEREERLLYTHDQLREEGLFDIKGIREYRPSMATDADFARVHFCPPGFSSVADAPHYISAGSALKAADLVLGGAVERSFALTRPPGHHAMRVVQGGRGFCAVNIEATMVAHIRKKYGVGRIAIVDTDCHHGDGTQDVFWHDPDTLVINLHQDGRTLYPGSGFPNELGGPNALGATVNIPLPPRTGDEGYLYVVNNLVRPLLDAWKPELVINSAGQDNHFSDPITDMRLSAQGYAALVETIDPHIAVLEGGYSIQGALPYVNLAVLLALAGLDYSNVLEPRSQRSQSRTGEKELEYIKRLTGELADVIDRAQEIPHGYTSEDGWWVRQRQIYYDTDGIREEQYERLRQCDQCPGTLLIQTQADRQRQSLCVFAPRHACEKCTATAEDAFHAAQKKGVPAEYYSTDADVYLRA